MLIGIPTSAMCVQRFNDSRNSAIHITYRISLRSSSLQEPRDPLPKVVFLIYLMFKKNFKLLFNGQNGIIFKFKKFFLGIQKLARTSILNTTEKKQ